MKVRKYNFFQRKVVLLVIYLFNHDSSKSTIFVLNMTLTFSWAQFLSNTVNWNPSFFII